jgi:hypothetical protein
MAVFQPTYKDPKTGELKKSDTWWYDFRFAGKRIRESAHTRLKTLAKTAEQNRRRELEQGINGLTDGRDDRIKSIREIAESYLSDYKLRHRSTAFADYALGHVKRLWGTRSQ